MPTTREASTPSRRAIRKAASNGTPISSCESFATEF
jgi:hypothetical protein